MLITSYQPADENSRFARDAFDSCVGREVPMHLPDGTTTKAVLVAVTVVDDGAGAKMTFAVDDSLSHQIASR